MDDANAKHEEQRELAKAQFQEEIQKNLAAHRRDEITYTRHISAIKKAFLDFIYRNPNSLEPSNPIQDMEEVECNGAVKEKQLEKPQNLKGGHDTPIVVAKEQTQTTSQ